MGQLKSVNYFLSSESKLNCMLHVLYYLTQKRLRSQYGWRLGLEFKKDIQAMTGGQYSNDLYLALVFTPWNKPSLVLMLAFTQPIRILLRSHSGIKTIDK